MGDEPTASRIEGKIDALGTKVDNLSERVAGVVAWQEQSNKNIERFWSQTWPDHEHDDKAAQERIGELEKFRVECKSKAAADARESGALAASVERLAASVEQITRWRAYLTGAFAAVSAVAGIFGFLAWEKLAEIDRDLDGWRSFKSAADALGLTEKVDR